MYHDYNIVRPAHMPEWMKRGLAQNRLRLKKGLRHLETTWRISKTKRAQAKMFINKKRHYTK